MIDQAADRHVHERAQLLQYVGGKYDARDFLTPGIFANPVAEVLRSVGLEGIHTKARSIATDVQRLGKEIQSLTLARTHAENVKVTGHLIRGVHFSKLARELDEDPPKIKKALNDALAEYEAALALRAEDVVALEGAIDQCEALGAREKMSGYLEALIQSPIVTALQSARALRRSAELLQQSLNEEMRHLARGRLQAAIANLDASVPDQKFELVEALIVYGTIQGMRGRLPTARKTLKRAAVLGDSAQQVRANDALRQAEAKARAES